MQKVTAILTCFQRFKNFERVLQSWLDQPEVDEVIVFDNSGNFKTELPVFVISAKESHGPIVRFVCPLFAKNDWILFADDDILAKPNLVKDLLSYSAKDKIVGILGKCFTGPSYYKSTGGDSRILTEPKRVDYLAGITMLSHRENSLVDIRKCPNWYVEDWWWERETGKELYVVPTKNWELLPESNDATALHKTREAHEARERYFKKWRRITVTDPHRLYYQRPFDDQLLKGNDLVGAEIGVYRGAHAKEMLERLDIRTLYLVDPWEDYEGYKDLQIIKKNLQNAYKTAKERMLKPYEDRLKWLKEFSVEAVKRFKDNSLDFVYIDGNHGYEFVKEDIEIWYPKVKGGGIVGGHDYLMTQHEIKQAVDEFCRKENLVLHLKRGYEIKGQPDPNSDWWVFKK